MFYERKLHNELKKHLETRQISLVTGMRRTGKTTLIKTLLSECGSTNTLFIDFERVDNRDLFSQKNYENIILNFEQRGLNTKEKMFIALDEIQLAPLSVSTVKYIYDHYDVKFFITGSSSYYLKNIFSESLAGRKKIFELFPLDFGEFLTFKNIPHISTDFLKESFNASEYERLRSYYEEFIQFGGFPEVVLANMPEEKKDILNDIISSYINIDIATLADFRRNDVIYSLSKMLAERVGSRLDYAKLSRLIGVSAMTIQSYVDFFEKTYLISRVPAYSKNADREIVKAKKLYFCDTGLLFVLGGVGSGQQFENALYSQLRHHGDLSYFALKNGQEIDFILNKETALEAKETPIQSDENPLMRIAQKSGIKKHKLIGRRSSPHFTAYIWGGSIL